MTKLPAVSILMAVRNEERYLPAALDSIKRQTMSDWELVIVDDGSTDSTPEILQKYADNDKRFRCLRQNALGLVPALNLGMTYCRAELMARMDGDDICHPTRLEKQLKLLNDRPEVDLVACDIRHFPSHYVQGGMRHYEQWQNSLHKQAAIMRNIFVESPFTQPSVMFHKKTVERAGGYRDMGWAEDYDLWLRLAENGAIFARIPETLFFWREHPDRLTHTSEHCSLDAFRRCKAHFLKRDYLKDCNKVTLWGAGIEGKAWRKTLIAENIEVGSWIDIDPGKIGQIIHKAKVADPDSLQPDHGPMLITIGARGARQLVRNKCQELGLIETVDFVCVT